MKDILNHARVAVTEQEIKAISPYIKYVSITNGWLHDWPHTSICVKLKMPFLLFYKRKREVKRIESFVAPHLSHNVELFII